MARDPVRDVVRGLTSLEMTFVNISHLQWTAHSPYIGQVAYADTIFPCFAFLSGMSPTPTRKNVGILGIGLTLNSISAFASGKSIRIPGVLQRLGLSSIIANEPRLNFLREYAGLPLVALWYAISLLSSKSANPLANADFASADVRDTAQTRIDEALFRGHLHTPTFDPEGLLGALTTAVSMVVGQVFAQGEFSTVEYAVGAVGMVSVGEALHFLLPKYAPISKGLWTPSFVLVTSGISILKYLAVDALLPYLPEVVTSALEYVGRRSLEIYVLSSLVTVALQYGGKKSIWSRAKTAISKQIGTAGSDLVMSSSLTGLMAVSARVMVDNQLRIRL